MTTKAEIRQKIWDYLETNNLANLPRPVHDRIPNFKGAGAAAHKLAGLEVFQKARVFKVNPDKPQEQVRFLILQNHSNTLLVPTPRLRHGLFNRIQPPSGANKEILRRCASAQGIRQFGIPVGLDDHFKVNMIVIGSVAVSVTGLRIGKGEGFADLECAMMKTMGAIDEDTIVVSTVHDCQVVDIPEELYAPHDVCVDIIVTPTRIIEVEPRRPKPPGVIWSYLTAEKFAQVPILRVLRRREADRGVNVQLKDEEPGKSTGTSGKANDGQVEVDEGFKSRGRGRRYGASSRVQREGATRDSKNELAQGEGGLKGVKKVALFPSLSISQLPEGTRVSELKAAVRSLEVYPTYVKWDGRNGRTFLDFRDTVLMEEALQKLANLKIGEVQPLVEISNRTKEWLKL